MHAYEAARAYIGVPFVHQGRSTRGLDCIGLVERALLDAGMEHYRLPANWLDYGRDPHRGLLEQRMAEVFGAPVADMQPGDVVAIKYAGPIRHVGLIGEAEAGGVRYLTLIHTDSHLGRVTEHRIDDRWARRIALVFRPRSAASIAVSSVIGFFSGGPAGQHLGFMHSPVVGGYCDPENIP